MAAAGGGGKNRDGSERTWNSKRGWRRRNAKTLSYALEENVACYSTVVLTVVAENAAGASEPSEPFERTLNGCWRDPTHVPTTAQPSSNPTPVPSLSPTGAHDRAADPRLSSSGSDGAVFVVVGAAGAVFLAILLACLFGFVWRKKRSARVAPMGEAPAPAPAPRPRPRPRRPAARRRTCSLTHLLSNCTRPRHPRRRRQSWPPSAPEAPAPEAPARRPHRITILARLAKCAGIYATGARGTRATAARGSRPPPARETASRIWLAWRRARARNADEVFAEIAAVLLRRRARTAPDVAAAAPETPARPAPEAAAPPAPRTGRTASRIWLAWRRARARNADGEVFAEIARLLRRPLQFTRQPVRALT